jgi:hypothetical protein
MRQMRNSKHLQLSRSLALLLLAVPSVSAQEIHFLPDVDTLSPWGTCSDSRVDFFLCNRCLSLPGCNLITVFRPIGDPLFSSIKLKQQEAPR